MLNDNYLPGALTLAYGLRRQGVAAPLVALYTDGVSGAAVNALAQLFDLVIEVERIYVRHARRQERQDRPFFFTRIQVLRLGPDGDLGLDLERVIVIDADVLPICRYSDLLDVPAPAGVLNERKSHLVEVNADGRRAATGEARRTGRFAWHEIYAECPHGQPIPRHITDRPATDPSNMGINGALFVMRPSVREYEEILRDLERPAMQLLVGDLFEWPDMQYLTMRWSGLWRNVDVRYSSMNGFPDLGVVFGTHFAGFKPWYFQREASMQRYARYPDFQLWFHTYAEMVGDAYPQLQRMGKLRRLLDEVRQVCRGVPRV